MTESVNTQQQTSFKVLLIGDSCTDRYNIGSVDRISPEAPVPVLKIVDTYDVPGMASNVNLNLINLNIFADFVTNTDPITKTRFIDERSGQHLLRVDDEPKVSDWNGDTPKPLYEYDAIIISDYNKGFLSYMSILSLIKGSECPIFIDTKKPDLNMFNMPDTYVKINEMEFNNSSSRHENLIVTLGSRGAMYNGEVYSTKKVEVMDVCGCGDTFMAALAAQFLFTKNIEKSIMFANIAAGITVQHRGNYAPTYDEIRNAGY
jgi:D-beta-D-heptose 7-phosphate kinase/D-beta-D-heptose 1-phosphate adenosyltransferase